jgi:hypothetical protein
MSSLAVLSGMSNVLARLAVRPGRGGQPTDRWQDKSRKLPRGRLTEECRDIKHLARGATAHDSLPIRATACNCATTRTSPASAS